MKRVMAIDPGTTTGIAIMTSGRTNGFTNKPWKSTLELTEISKVIEFLEFFGFGWFDGVCNSPDYTMIYIEKPFIFNQNKHKIKQAVAFYELTIMLCEEFNIPWEPVAPSFHKGWLRQAKAYIGSPQKLHAQDALAILIGKNEIPIDILKHGDDNTNGNVI